MLFPPDWAPKDRGTLVFVRSGAQVLLIQKKRGHGAGKINAPGGRVEAGETAAQCAVREVFEEVGLRCPAVRPMAKLRFRDLGNGFAMLGFVFSAWEFAGEPTETEEAAPFWCAIDAVPFDAMWEDDRFWLPYVLAGQRVRGDFLFRDDKLLDHRLECVETLEFA